MKRKTATILCTALSAMFLLTGCGSEREQQQVSPSYEETEATITPSEKPTESELEEESQVEDSEIQEEITEEDVSSEGDASSSLFEIENPVIYEAEGVTVTMDEWKLEGDSVTMTCSITNNNLDNQRVTFSSSCYIDGFHFNKSLSFDSLDVGASDTREVKFSLDNYLQFKEEIGAESLPIESLSFSYDVQIGSYSEPTSGHITFKNPDVGEDYFLNVYGDKIDDFEFVVDETSYRFEFYQKHIEENNQTLFTLKRVDNSDDNVLRRVYNTRKFSIGINLEWLMEGYVEELYLPGFGDLDLYCDGGIVCIICDTPENIRRALEIPNDVPLEGYLSFVVQSSYSNYRNRPLVFYTLLTLE